MKNFNVEVFIKDLDKLFNDMQDKAIAGSENVATASWVIKQQLEEIEKLKTKTLTDEEITEIYKKVYVALAKELLRKAQKK